MTPVVPRLEDVGLGSPLAHVHPDELLVIVGCPGGVRAPWIQELIKAAAPVLSGELHNLRYHVGLRQARSAPYVVLEWVHPGNSALERRWVAYKLGAQLAAKFHVKSIAVYLEGGAGAGDLAIAEDLLTRHMTARYERSRLDSFRLLTPAPTELAAVDPHFTARLGAQLTFRRWVNENPDELTSLVLGERLHAFCRQHGCRFETLDTARLTELGMNLLLAVGQASEHSPSRLHIATHNLTPGAKPLLLIGKGITFDTGGINLKSHEGHVNAMKNDMGGAGLMINMFTALVESGYPGPLAVVIPCCENLIGSRAMKPGAVIKSHAGLDVLIEHTDAEGRLILADALHYAQKRLDPALTIIAATLTTASLRQFTNFYTAVHFASQAFQAGLEAAGAAWGEGYTFWGEFLPFLEGNRTSAADLTNMGRMPSHANIGGACNVAAHFLKEFAVAPLVHVDIFASTWNWSGDYPGAHYGATGAPFNSLFRFLRETADPATIVT